MSSASGAAAHASVLRLAGIDPAPLAALLGGYGLELRLLAQGAELPGSYWGDSEAGLVERVLYARPDTPVHSVLHEAGHFICMTGERRAGLHRDAGGDDAEECAVCLLQLLLAATLPAVGEARLMADMDAWGYSFRLGSTAAWLREESGDARQWLQREGIIDGAGCLTAQLRA